MGSPTVGHSLRTRQKIQTTQLINRLHQHAFGEIELTVSQVQSIKVLLNKSLPDVRAIDPPSDPNDRDAKTITNSGLLRVIEGTATRVDNKKAG